jgi:hypothetical protein
MSTSRVRIGVYAVRNLADGAAYVGSALDIDARWSQHRAALDRSCHPNQALQAAWLQRGAEAFEWIVVERIDDPQSLAQAEQRWIASYRASGLNRVYNADSRVIRRLRTPLSLEQAAGRLHISPRRLQIWVTEGRVPCYHPPRPSPRTHLDLMSFDREEIDEAVRQMRQPHRDRRANLVLRLQAVQQSIGRWLHPAG